MFTQTAVFSTLALFASVSHAIPSTYTSLHSRAVNKRVTKEDVFWLKESETAGPIFEQAIIPYPNFMPLLTVTQ